MNFPIRYVAQIVIEAITPLAVGSDLLADDQDSPVEKDFNGLPFIPGTAIAGYLRKNSGVDSIFGDKADENKEQPKGSNLIVSDAFLMDKQGKVKQQVDEINDVFLEQYLKLPVRQHTAINEFGAAKDGSKFDTEIVFKGSRFKFEIELQLKDESDDNWKKILNSLFSDNFYLGGGQFNNFGEMKVVKIKYRKFDLSNEDDKNAYLEHDVDLNKATQLKDTYTTNEITTNFTEKSFEFSGKESFFHFGAGLGDDEVDNVNYKEKVVEGWDTGNPDFVEKFVIPGTSIKGVLAHRVAYHYNKDNDIFVETLLSEFEKDLKERYDQKYGLNSFTLANNLEDLEKQKEELTALLEELKKESFKPSEILKKATGENNKAVNALFGMAKDGGNKAGKTGNIIFKDVYLDGNTPEIIFNHNKIDRYTGGTIESALFNEKVLAIDKATIVYKVKKSINESILNKALADLKTGKLPIGGLVNKGHGIINEIKTAENGN